jgi:hypothetical protein
VAGRAGARHRGVLLRPPPAQGAGNVPPLTRVKTH